MVRRASQANRAWLVSGARRWILPRDAVLANQQREHSRQQHEHQRLNQPDEQFQKVEGDLDQPGDVWHLRHGFEHRFTGEDVAVESKAERDRTEQNRDDLEEPGGKEDDHHEHLQCSRRRSLGREHLLEETHGPEGSQAPDDPAGEEHEGHGERQVDVGVGASKERFLELETLRRVVPPSHRADARDRGRPSWTRG